MTDFQRVMRWGTTPFVSCRLCKRGIACDFMLSVAEFYQALRDEGWVASSAHNDTCPACRTHKSKKDKHYWQRKYINEPYGMPFAYHCTDHHKPYKVRHG